MNKKTFRALELNNKSNILNNSYNSCKYSIAEANETIKELREKCLNQSVTKADLANMVRILLKQSTESQKLIKETIEVVNQYKEYVEYYF